MGEYQIRKFERADVDFVKAHKLILGLALEYNQDYDMDRALKVVNDENQVVGVGVLSYHNTWYDLKPKADHKVVFEYCLEKGHEAAFSKLIQGAELIYKNLKQAEKKMSLIYFCEANALQEVQKFFHEGFCVGELIPVLKYDLSQQIKHEKLPNALRIEPLEPSKEKIEAYIEATAKAHEGLADSLAQFLFQMQDESFKTFVAYAGNQIVGGISIWAINEKRGATENIFTLPAYRRKKVASELIATAFEALKARGVEEATLSMLGSNAKAMRVYQKVGYELSYYLIELKKEADEFI